MEKGLSQKDINKEVYKYLYEVEKHLNEHYSSDEKGAIVIEIETHLKEKLAAVEKERTITTSVLNEVLSDFGEAGEIAAGYLPNVSNSSSKRTGFSLKTWTRLEAFHAKLYPLPLHAEAGLYLAALVWLCVTFFLIPCMFVGCVADEPGATAAYVIVIGGYVVMQFLMVKRRDVRNYGTKQASRLTGNSIIDPAAFRSRRAPAWQLIAFMGLFGFAALSQSGFVYSPVIYLSLLFGQIPLFLLSNRRPIAVPHHLVALTPPDNLNFMAMRERKNFAIYKGIFKLLAFGGLCWLLKIAADWNSAFDYSSYRYHPLFYNALYYAVIAYAGTTFGLWGSMRAMSMVSARVFGVLRIIALIFLLFLIAILLLRQGSVILGRRFLDGNLSISTQIIVLIAFFTFTWWAFRYTRLNVVVIEASLLELEKEITRWRCARCGFLAKKGFKYCPECGGKLQIPRTATLASESPPCKTCGELVGDQNAKFCPKCGGNIGD